MTAQIVEWTEQAVSVAWDDGAERRLSALWLRDNVPAGRHREGGQRTFDICEIETPRILDARIAGEQLSIRFADATAAFSLEWLLPSADGDLAAGGVLPPPRPWDASLQATLDFVDYGAVRSDLSTRLEWLQHLRDYGFGLLENVPTAPGTVVDVAGLFGFVRETNYGRLFDVEVEADPANLANTAGRIGMHTDNPYRDPVPGLQLLHCLTNESEGGESQLCDGHRIAMELREDAPEAFALLVEYPVRFRYLEAGHTDLQAYRPLVETHALGGIRTIRYNSRSAEPLRLPADVIDDYYAAYRALGRRLNAAEARVEFRLRPGDCIVLDNERVLHGRSEYSGGHRHLQGCYADKDGLHSAIRVLEAS